LTFKRQIAQAYLSGETPHGLAKQHDLSRNLVRLWVAKFEAGELDDDTRAADLLQEYEAKVAALERMVGRRALEIEFLILLCHKMVSSLWPLAAWTSCEGAGEGAGDQDADGGDRVVEVAFRPDRGSREVDNRRVAEVA